MLPLLLSRGIHGITIRLLYVLWTRAAAAAFVLWAVVLASADSWIIEMSLMAILGLLLVAGVVLLFAGIRDLIRDFRRLLHDRSEQKRHAA